MIKNKKIYVCDKCNEEITGEVFDIAFGAYNRLDEVEDWDGNEFHLCEKCVTDILCFIDGYKENPFNKSNCCENSVEAVGGSPTNSIWKEIEYPANLSEVADLPFCSVKNDKNTNNPKDLTELIDEQLNKYLGKEKKKEKKEDFNLSQAFNNLGVVPIKLENIENEKRKEATSIPTLDVEEQLGNKIFNMATDIEIPDLFSFDAIQKKADEILNSLTPEEISLVRKMGKEKRVSDFFNKIVKRIYDKK